MRALDNLVPIALRMNLKNIVLAGKKVRARHDKIICVN